MKKSPVIEVNMPRKLRGNSRQSETHAHVLRTINTWAEKFGIEVRETAEAETAKSVRPSFIDEAERLRQAVPGINIPRTVRVSEFMSTPFFPMMLKMETAHRSKHKYLIENQGQFNTFLTWLKAHGTESEWICQKYIECPSDSYASFRVIADCTGEIHTSQLIYGAPKAMNLRHDKGDQHDSENRTAFLLEDPDSPFFLNAPVVASNRLHVERRTQPRRSEADTTVTKSVWDDTESQFVDRVISIFDRTKPARTYDDGQSQWADDVAVWSDNDGKRWLNQYYNDYVKWRYAMNDEGHIGGRATLGRSPASHPYNAREKELLADHGLTPYGLLGSMLPLELERVSSAVARELGMEGNIVKQMILGIDFVQDRKTKKLFLIEVNRRPRIMSIQDAMGGVTTVKPLEAHEYLIRETISSIAREFGMVRKA